MRVAVHGASFIRRKAGAGEHEGLSDAVSQLAPILRRWRWLIKHRAGTRELAGCTLLLVLDYAERAGIAAQHNDSNTGCTKTL
mmetsp:Transcript_31306/g.101131  ORF Transcript_31306/g.101131 Transcript_31306/m.101131 type:complete len:83 (+) Transcript_31306:668-916(+)